MPNQRKKTKALLGGYFEKPLIAELKRIAKNRGITVSALVEEILLDGVRDYEAHNPSRKGETK